jgi:hypothetical protein
VEPLVPVRTGKKYYKVLSENRAKSITYCMVSPIKKLIILYVLDCGMVINSSWSRVFFDKEWTCAKFLGHWIVSSLEYYTSVVMITQVYPYVRKSLSNTCNVHYSIYGIVQ